MEAEFRYKSRALSDYHSQMLLRSLTLQNFKNHRTLTWSNIDPGCNVLLGQNGQGKSNIHIALLYLFSDLYGSGGMAKKRELLLVGFF